MRDIESNRKVLLTIFPKLPSSGILRFFFFILIILPIMASSLKGLSLLKLASPFVINSTLLNFKKIFCL